jgi:hypothetical protein
MSYYAMSGVPSITQAAAGMGCCMSGLGAVDFNSGSVWTNFLAGANGNNAAGKAAGQAIQAALNQIGYGPLAVDGQLGAASVSAWTRFASDNGVGGTWPTQAGIIKLGEQVNKGGDQGGGGVVESHVVAGQIVAGASPTATGTSKASMSTMLGIGAVAIGAIALLAVFAKKKSPSSAAAA